jgi:hypothetical protein
MDLASKYDKSNLLGDGEVKVWRGRERSRGTPVLLHTFTGSPKLLLLATEFLLKRPPNSPLLDIGEWEGAMCLVTTSELDMLDVKAWLENALAAPAQRTAEPPVLAPEITTGPVAVPAQKPQAPGEFTRAFQLPSANAPAQPPDPMASTGPAKTPPGPGDFTRAFQIPSANVPAASLPDPMAASGPAKTPGPGEFTQLFRLPSQEGATGNQQTPRPPELGLPPSPPDYHPSTAPPSAPRAGEFTRLFRAQPNSNPPGELPPEPAAPRMNIATGPVALPLQSAPPEPKGPGEYTRVMQTPSLQTPMPQPSASPSPAAAQAVQIPISMTPPSIPSAPTPPSLPTPQVPYVQASMSVPQTPSVQAPSIQAPSVEVPAPAPRSGISPVVLLLGGLILVAVILVLIFALRR